LSFTSNFRKKISIFAGIVFAGGKLSFYLPFCDKQLAKLREDGKWRDSQRSDYILYTYSMEQSPF
jgi:hypothetical protein